MEKFSTLLVLIIVYFCGTLYAVPENTEHGSHGVEKHRSLHFKGGKHNEVYDYEALMGSRNYEELADLPDDVRRARLTTLAKSHDANKNGFIEKEELQDWVLHSFRMLDHQEAEERRHDEDENEDGFIEFSEILKKQFGYTQEEVDDLEKGKTDEHEESEVIEMIKDEKKKFQAADLDNNGKLSADEYVAFTVPHDYPHMHAMELEKSMKELDEDKDGVISMNEFIRDGTIDEEERLSEVTNFEELDKDKDGKLTTEELKPWLLFDNNESAKEEVEHLIRECDEDEDGHISIEEVINKEEDFITSHITDHGRHLHFVKDEL